MIPSFECNNNIDLFYVIVLFPHQNFQEKLTLAGGTVEPSANRDNATARVRRYKCLKTTSAGSMANHPEVWEWVSH